MTTTFDRYLLRRFLHVFGVSFLTTFGLFVVIDAFTNIDGFQERTVGQGYGALFYRIAKYYTYQASPFFDLAGPILTVVAAMVVFAMLQKNSEIHPILSAGIPTYRLVIPLLLGAFAINVLLTVNQELIIPAIAEDLRAPRGLDESTPHNVEPVCDHASGIAIYGEELFLDRRVIRQASFVLPVPGLVDDLTTLRCSEAVYRKHSVGHPSGWLLTDVRPRFHEIPLTKTGQKLVLPTDDPDGVFVVSDVSLDQLHQRNMSYRFLATSELMRRIQSPAFGLMSLRGLSLHFHERLTRPLLNLIAVLITVPFVVRKGSDSLVANMALCTTVLGALFILAQGTLYLGRVNLMAVELAAWFPIIVGGTFCVWASDRVQT